MKKQLILLVACLFIICSFSFADSKYYQDETGNTIHLAIPEPTGTNIASDKTWLLTLIQTQLIDTFTKYSPINVIDRQNEKMAQAEIEMSENGSYSEEGFAEFGKFVNADHVVATKIINTGSSYSLSIRINHVETNKTMWTYSDSKCYPAGISDGSVVNKAVQDLLGQIGVKLTEAGILAINGGVDANTLNRQQNLSKGINAQKRGATSIEAMEYFYAAADYDPNNAEAQSRLNSLSASVSSNDLGERIKSQTELYDYWTKTINEANTYFNENLPYEIFYSTELEEEFTPIKHNDGTTEKLYSLKFQAGNSFKTSSAKTLSSLHKDLVASGQEKYFNNWPYNEDFIDIDNTLYVTIQLVNQMDEPIATTDISMSLDRVNLDKPKEVLNCRTYSFKKVSAKDIEGTLTLKITKVQLKKYRTLIEIPLDKIKISTLEQKQAELRELNMQQLLEQQKKEQAEQIQKQQVAKETEKKEKASRDGLTLAYSPTFVGSQLTDFIDCAIFLSFKDYTFWEFSCGVGIVSDSMSSDESVLNGNAFLDYGLNHPIGNAFQLYGLLGIGVILSQYQGFWLGSGFAARIGCGLDIACFTLEYSLDYIFGNGFADRYSIGYSILF